MLRGKLVQASLCIYNTDCTVVKADRSPSASHVQFCPEPEAVIDGEPLKWPKLEIRNAVFGGTQEKIKALSCIE
jgi:hypothetical protein